MHKICWITIGLRWARWSEATGKCAATQQFAGMTEIAILCHRPRRNMKNGCAGRLLLPSSKCWLYAQFAAAPAKQRTQLVYTSEGKAIKWQAEERNSNSKMGIKISPAQMMAKSFQIKCDGRRWQGPRNCVPHAAGNMKHCATLLYKRQQWF